MKRLVVDSNTLASGIAGIRSGAPPALLIRAMQALRKPYFRERVSTEEVREAVTRIEEVAIAFDDPSDVEPTLRDPKDDYLLALAREAGAEAIVSGDKDLLDHTEDLEPPAISPRAACELFGLID